VNERVPLPEVTFSRKDPQTYVVLVARAGPEGVLLGTRSFKPPGTEFATTLDLFEAGFVPEDMLLAALALLDIDQRHAYLKKFVALASDEERPVAQRIADQLEARVQQAHREHVSREKP
jgi:hypothetical protein